MISTPAFKSMEKIDDGVTLKQMDDVCFVKVANRPTDMYKTRELGEKLIAFIEQAGCHKLVMSLEGMECIYGFLLNQPPHSRYSIHPPSKPVTRSHALAAGSDLWVG